MFLELWILQPSKMIEVFLWLRFTEKRTLYLTDLYGYISLILTLPSGIKSRVCLSLSRQQRKPFPLLFSVRFLNVSLLSFVDDRVLLSQECWQVKSVPCCASFSEEVIKWQRWYCAKRYDLGPVWGHLFSCSFSLSFTSHRDCFLATKIKHFELYAISTICTIAFAFCQCQRYESNHPNNTSYIDNLRGERLQAICFKLHSWKTK